MSSKTTTTAKSVSAKRTLPPEFDTIASEPPTKQFISSLQPIPKYECSFNYPNAYRINLPLNGLSEFCIYYIQFLYITY